jgi:hypothetical protein
MRVVAFSLVGFLMLVMIELINALGHCVSCLERLALHLQKPRLTAGEQSRIDRRELMVHDPPGIGGVRSTEQRHGPINRAPTG